MSNFMLISADARLWQPVTKARWSSHDFCPVVKGFQVQAILQSQLNTLSLAGAWGDIGKSQWGMTFFFVAPSLAIRCKRVFGLTAVLAHLHQACFQSLEDAAHKLVLLVDKSTDWPYAFVQLNDAVSHELLSNEGHVSTVMDAMPSTDACGQLHQLEICELLQDEGKVVCLEGLNGEVEGPTVYLPRATPLGCCHSW